MKVSFSVVCLSVSFEICLRTGSTKNPFYKYIFKILISFINIFYKSNIQIFQNISNEKFRSRKVMQVRLYTDQPSK